MVPGGMRNIHDNKVSGQMASNSANHNSSDDYMGMVHGTMGSGVGRSHSTTATLSRHTQVIRLGSHYTRMQCARCSRGQASVMQLN